MALAAVAPELFHKCDILCLRIFVKEQNEIPVSNVLSVFLQARISRPHLDFHISSIFLRGARLLQFYSKRPAKVKNNQILRRPILIIKST